MEEVENVRVVVRVRPMNEAEVQANYENAVEVDSAKGSLSLMPPNKASEPPKVFTFDLVFGPDSKQVDVYNSAARPIVENVLEGYNGTIFAYGQTGTGKTFTMEGDRAVPELRGIIPNSFAHIFGHISRCEDNKNFLVRVSYLEIYNEEVRDLLMKGKRTNLEVRERADIGVYVKDLSAYVVNNADDMDRIMTVGNKNRVVGWTKMNEHSSRSHAIFMITVESSERGVDGQQHVRMGKLNLVDLAGSERQSKTGATGERFKEATKINLSLSTLGNVISSLVDGKSTHIPYRDSKLTRLLMDSLGGNARTVMCANVGPANYNYEETLSTLRYANRAKNIKNRAHINEDPKDALLRQFQKEIEELRQQLEEGSEGSDAEEPGGNEGEDERGLENEGEKRKKRFKRRSSILQIQDIMAQMEEEKRLLAEKKDMEEEERQRISMQLKKQEEDLQIAQSERNQLLGKLHNLEKKIIIGGENLLEKAEEQERLLEESARELQERKQKETELTKAIGEKEAERLDIEEKYSSLQEEAAGKTKKLKKLSHHLLSVKSELEDLKEEHQREMEGLMENVRELSRELQLQSLIIDAFIPHRYQDLIDENIHWSEDIGEWQLKCVAYTGNNMRKISSPNEMSNAKHIFEPDLSSVYLSYTPDGPRNPVRPKSHRPKTAAGRPKSSKR
ncbi:unnamed protein product [Darwinula stevensoni]|uniref:Kinesin-like protein n=1 Tax=Darwinula stevensoni TaxID=69355 RepID=A0A7R8WY27_9CRUS|nr:unnamed protein product [Darwinula stevensoni]CAG0878873.1 unnamed protein product [Darwinula stevensoni]